MLPGTQQIGNWSALYWTEWLPHRFHSKEVHSSPLNGAKLTPGLVQTLAADWMSGHQATVLKTSSNTTIPEAWITDPATESWNIVTLIPATFFQWNHLSSSNLQSQISMYKEVYLNKYQWSKMIVFVNFSATYLICWKLSPLSMPKYLADQFDYRCPDIYYSHMDSHHREEFQLEPFVYY